MALVLKQTCETMKQNQRPKHVHNYSHLIFDKEIRNISWRKYNIFIKWSGKTDIHKQQDASITQYKN